jgi:hypothetical protein
MRTPPWPDIASCGTAVYVGNKYNTSLGTPETSAEAMIRLKFARKIWAALQNAEHYFPKDKL